MKTELGAWSHRGRDAAQEQALMSEVCVPGAKGFPLSLKGHLCPFAIGYTLFYSKLINDGHSGHTFPVISLSTYCK